ncbi:MarR family winged helix-turn-helix transcriptional regulator [Thauera sp.]|uniref:MarR family winged helix-turn-helix transcriptional regulator n=1 Tax=Thauera sp. TaxID=1905334 RepID=UPI0039E2B00C
MSTATLYLERLSTLFQQAVREDAARHGLLPIHIQVLQYLAQANQYSDLPIAIADYFGITRGTVSQTLAVLERKALIIKQADARHGKRIHLKLTPAGMAVMQDSWAERMQRALDMQADGAALADTLRDILVALQRLNGQHAFGICRQCAHFRTDGDTTRCGLTGETLAVEQTGKICREWATSA